MSESLDKIERSLRVYDLPENYVVDEILKTIELAGCIEEVNTGKQEVIITFTDVDEKDMAKMYEGCQVLDKYPLKLEDATYLNPKNHQVSEKEREDQSIFTMASFTRKESKIERSLRVYDLPENYVVDEIIKIIEVAAEIEDFDTGKHEVIITFTNKKGKNRAKIYEGCHVVDDKYPLKLEDATYLKPKKYQYQVSEKERKEQAMRILKSFLGGESKIIDTIDKESPMAKAVVSEGGLLHLLHQPIKATKSIYDMVFSLCFLA